MFLEAGAKFDIYIPASNARLVHIVVREERRNAVWTPQQRADYQSLINWLESKGESVKVAKSDIKRWDSWSRTTGEFRRKMDAEIAARERREAQAEKSNDDAPAHGQ